jgi:hypothetical protein
MLHEVAQKAVNSGFSVVKPLEDETGAFGYWLRRDDRDYGIVVKEYSYKNLASFMKTIVDGGAERDWYLIFYEDSEGTSTLFDAKYVEEHGRPSSGDSKTKFTEWVEIERDYGIPLGDHLHRDAEPPTLAGKNATLTQF